MEYLDKSTQMDLTDADPDLLAKATGWVHDTKTVTQKDDQGKTVKVEVDIVKKDVGVEYPVTMEDVEALAKKYGWDTQIPLNGGGHPRQGITLNGAICNGIHLMTRDATKDEVAVVKGKKAIQKGKDKWLSCLGKVEKGSEEATAMITSFEDTEAFYLRLAKDDLPWAKPE